MIDQLINNGSQSISKLALFIFIISGNFVSDVFSCSLRKLLQDNILIKHLVAFFILLLFVGLEDTETTMINKIYMSLGLYAWFIFIMRSPLIVSTIVTVSIVAMYTIQGFITDYENIGENTDFLIQTRNTIFVCSFLLSLIGFIYFTLQNRIMFKNDFSIYKFIVGLNNKECFKLN
jgi:hypothetical protein